MVGIQKIEIRAAEESDVSAILEIYSPFVLETPVTFEEIVPSHDEMKERIFSITKEYPFLVCEIDGTLTGFAYAVRHRNREAYRWAKELSVYVHPDFRRKKIGLALYTSLIEMLIYQGVTLALAGITVPNPVSVSFHESLGFRKVAHFDAIGYKTGKWQSVGWWALNLNPKNKAPAGQLIPFPEIQKSNLFQDAVTKGMYKITL